MLSKIGHGLLLSIGGADWRCSLLSFQLLLRNFDECVEGEVLGFSRGCFCFRYWDLIPRSDELNVVRRRVVDSYCKVSVIGMFSLHHSVFRRIFVLSCYVCFPFKSYALEDSSALISLYSFCFWHWEEARAHKHSGIFCLGGVWILLDWCGWPSTFGRFSKALLVSKNLNLDFVLLFVVFFGGTKRW